MEFNLGEFAHCGGNSLVSDNNELIKLPQVVVLRVFLLSVLTKLFVLWAHFEGLNL